MKKNLVKEPENPKDMLPPEVTEPPTPSDDYLPWWTGVNEVSIYFNKENAEAIDSHFELAHPVKCPLFIAFTCRPRRKVNLVKNPLPQDSNEYGPFMDDVIDIKVVAMIQDEHAQVVGAVCFV